MEYVKTLGIFKKKTNIAGNSIILFIKNAKFSEYCISVLSVIDVQSQIFKVGLPPSKKIFFIHINESPLKMMKNTFYFFMLKIFFVLEIVTFLS